MIVEKASGESYYDYVREHIYAPAGMTGTDAYEVDAVVPNLAQGYERIETDHGVTYRSNILEHTARGGPAGGGYSTVPDLLAFARALQDGRLIRPENAALPHNTEARRGFTGLRLRLPAVGAAVGCSDTRAVPRASAPR